MSTIELLILGLAAWRYSYMAVHEDGLFDGFDRLRKVAARVNELDKLFSCIYCMSIWVAGGLLLLRAFTYPVFEVITVLGAVSAIAIITHRTIERLST